MNFLRRLLETKKIEEENKQLRKMLDTILSNPNLIKIIQES